jgi:DnaJ-class molecular chaperone
LAIESDYFTVLGIDRSADASEVRRAHARLTKEIAPENIGPDLWHDLRAQLETIREVFDEALRILATPILRAAYEFNLAHGPDADVEPDPRAATPSPSLLGER